MAGNYYLAPEYEDPSCNFSTNFTCSQNDNNNNMPSSLHFVTNLPYYHHQPQMPMVDFYPQSSSLSYNNSSTSDEAEEINQMSIINERKQRRMISNRESARRSRMRKQKQLDELCTQVLRLRNENHGLMEKLNHFSETHEQVIQENHRLKKETTELKQLLSEAQLATTYTNLRDLDDDDHEEGLVPNSCTTAYLMAQSSKKSTSKNSSNLLRH
ncbi:hypothetical protein L6452_20872 [Arctium lappa]|uniref:Uncharacterized protein n=1 Tax=Arctium lappa TaxID=4217 RepID=A0ACB9BDW0_ARCLA|nr:hypothetical protein L6452_20872 [Arctium lappa]